METSFGNWIRRRRKSLDLTQDELARRVGCSSSLIFKIETDERRPSRQIAELLAVQLDIPVEHREMFLKVARQEVTPLRLHAPDSFVKFEPASGRKAQPSSKAEPTQESQGHGDEIDAQLSALPVFPTSFIGREHEIEIIVQQILDPACRLLTLTGPGGVGKTRLAVEVARRLEPFFHNEVFFLPMAGVDQPETILPEIAGALGLAFSGPAEPKVQLIRALRNRNALLVFDNMEHLVAGSAVLGEILQQAQGLRMLLTSREPIHLQWEWIFEVQGLPVPESAHPDVLDSNSAPVLFMQRLRQVTQRTPTGLGISSTEETALRESAHFDAPDHDPLDLDARAIIQICKLVDGLPLAIELAASWARIMSPAEIAEELAHGLDILETGMQDVPARHRSIRLVFDHSWKLLSGEERAVLMKLAVFPGGFTREAAQSVAGASVMLLSALVSKSLLRYGKKAGRYDFHELVRQYALKQLGEYPDQEQIAHARHCEFYAKWMADLEIPLKSAQQMATSARIQAEMGNISAAWRWAARNRRLDLLRQMNPCLYWYDEIHGYNPEAVSGMTYTVNELLAAGVPATLTTDVQKATYALLVDQLGWFEFRTGNTEQAAALFAEALTLAQSLSELDYEVLYYINVNWGYMTLITGDLERSEQFTKTSLENARLIGGRWHAAISINILGIIEYQRGHLTAAYQQLTDSLKLWREVGDLRGLVFCMLYLSAAALALEDYRTVEEILRESNTIAQQKHDRWAHAFGQDLLGQVALARGQVQPAIEYFRHSLALSQEISDQWAATLAHIHLGDAHLALNDRAEAQRFFRQAFENARQARWQSTILEVLAASLAADHETPAETRLAITLALLSHPAVTLTIRQRAERLRDQLVSTLDNRQIELIRIQANQKPVEEWASAYFRNIGADRSQFKERAGGWSAASQLA